MRVSLFVDVIRWKPSWTWMCRFASTTSMQRPLHLPEFASGEFASNSKTLQAAKFRGCLQASLGLSHWRCWKAEFTNWIKMLRFVFSLAIVSCLRFCVWSGTLGYPLKSCWGFCQSLLISGNSIRAFASRLRWSLQPWRTSAMQWWKRQSGAVSALLPPSLKMKSTRRWGKGRWWRSRSQCCIAQHIHIPFIEPYSELQKKSLSSFSFLCFFICWSGDVESLFGWRPSSWSWKMALKEKIWRYRMI